MSYDPKCEELASHFMPASGPPHLVKQLAQHIQDSVEEWLIERRDMLVEQILQEDKKQ